MKAVLKSEPPEEIRCSQSGDWWYDDNVFIISVRNDIPKKSQLAILIHELIEAYLCRQNKITDDQVCAFDEQYEKERAEGKHPADTEPGDAEDSPYRYEHQMASHVEMAVCQAIGLPWKEHCTKICAS